MTPSEWISVPSGNNLKFQTISDRLYIIGPKGEGAVDFLWSSIHDDLEPVVKAYADAHNGIAPEDPDEYLTYAESEAQKEAIEKLKLWNEVRTGF